jgi:hypothetical protein
MKDIKIGLRTPQANATLKQFPVRCGATTGYGFIASTSEIELFKAFCPAR